MLPDPNSAPVEPLASSEDEEEPTLDIRYIKPVPGSLGRAERPFTTSNVFWGLWLTPLAAIVAVGAWVLYTRRRAIPSEAGGPSRARETVLARLATIEQGASAADAASAALHGYLDARLAVATAGLPAEDISRMLEESGVTPDTCGSLVSLLDRLAEMRFARYETSGNEEVGRDVGEIVRKLDEELSE